MENEPQGDLLQGRTPAGAAGSSREDQWQSLSLALAFAGLFMMGFCVSVLMWWQTRQVRRQLDQNQMAIDRFQRIEEPLIGDVLSKLEAYGQQNRDFMPLLQKYAMLFPRLQQPASTAPPATPAPPKPATR